MRPEVIQWHTLSAKDVLHALSSDAHGLSEEESQARLKTNGKNTVESKQNVSVLRRFMHQFCDPLIYVLLVAGGITALMQHWTDTSVITVVILLNALIGFIQEQKAENALAAIRDLLSPRANVLRAGTPHLIDATLLVTGDIVVLAAGDKVPADIRLLSAHSLRMQEAILTGESLDIEKSTHEVSSESSLGERTCMAYSGTLVTAGQGKGVVVATGEQTEIGHISTMLGEVESPETPLTRKLARFSRLLAIGIVAVAVSIFCFGVFVRGLPINEMFMVMIAITVSAIPEGLPAIISITLALGVRAMAKRNAIVRHLPVIEALGSATVICTDKTGTLTKNELAVTDIITAEHSFFISGVGYSPEGNILFEDKEIALSEHPAVCDMGCAAILNNDATLTCKKGVWELNGDPTEGALMAFARKAGHDRKETREAWPRADVIPFSAEAQYMATLHHGEEESIIYVKGAPEKIFAMCSTQRRVEVDEPLNIKYWQEKSDALARQGKRILAIASRPANKTHKRLRHEDVKSELTLLGLFGIIDTPREEAKHAIAACLAAGIGVKMITGDHVLTASSIGKMLGIQGSEKVMEGKDMERMSDEALIEAVDGVNIYARMHPEHKLRLVKALQAKGETVAMTGDGVNDAPALKMADIGIAMGKQGTEVAKKASSLVLADDNFASIVCAVEEGRNIYRNIKRTIQFMLVTDCCEGVVLIIAMLMGLTLPVTPLQILWVNMVTSVALSLSFAFAPYDPDVMHQPPLPLHTPIFSRMKIMSFLWHIVIITAGTIGLFLYEMRTGSIDTARTIAVNTLVAFQVYYLWGLLLVQKKAERGIKPYAPLFISTIAIIILQLTLTYAPWMQNIFATTHLSLRDWGEVNAVAAIILVWILVERYLIGIIVWLGGHKQHKFS